MEAKQVHLCWRVQTGFHLYPEWETYPHVTNFYAPIYYWCTGWLGKLFDADLNGLFYIGRLVTVSVNLLTLLAIALFLRERYSTSAAVAGLIAGLGASPLLEFAVMVRPDLMADCLGISGFLLVTRARRRAVLVGGVLLVLACLTKQTALYYLAAAFVSCWLVQQLRPFRWILLAESAAVLVVFVLVLQLLEPNPLRNLFGEAGAPFSAQNAFSVLRHLLRTSPDLIFFAVVGIFLWIRSQPPEKDLAILATVLLMASVTTSAKLGADLNYYIGLRAIEMLALAKLWHSVAPARLSQTFAVAVLGSLLMWISVRHTFDQFVRTRQFVNYVKSEKGRDNLLRHDRVLQLAEQPDLEILTDSGMVALRQREWAPFVDPYLFRLLVHSGRIDPTVIAERIRSQYYDALILTSELYTSPVPYERYDFGLPLVLVQAAKGRYELVGCEAGLFIYRRVHSKDSD